MKATLTVSYTTDNEQVKEDVYNIITSCLPYMVDNVDIKLVEED